MNGAELSHLLPCARPMHLSCLLLPHHHVGSPGLWDLTHQAQLVVECCDLIKDQRRDLCSLLALVKLFLIPCFAAYFVSTFRHLEKQYLSPNKLCLFHSDSIDFFFFSSTDSNGA